ncbi:serine protease inhibitor ecotin [Shewanella sp. A25]|nr:serine protease inhibitor ecotin [Shewanella shenzhenensis]
MRLSHVFCAAVLPLALTLVSPSAFSVSPPHPTGLNAPMVSISSFTPKNYVQQETTKMFPAPETGMVQHILTLPKLENEDNYMLEIQIGQTKMVDCNLHFLKGELTEETLKGWGYSYFQLASVSDGPSTMKACIDNKQQEAFVRIPAEMKLKYDSRLPKVFYLPEGTELRFRTWKVDSTFFYAK